MKKYFFLAIITAAITFSSTANTQISTPPKPDTTDARLLVEMPELARFYMKQDMLDHLTALNEIIGLLATEDYDTLADVAENRMGRSSMGKYRSTGMGPGRFMPLEMRNIGWSMHDAATELSELAKKRDLTAGYQALQKITTACVLCHSSYRVR